MRTVESAAMSGATPVRSYPRRDSTPAGPPRRRAAARSPREQRPPPDDPAASARGQPGKGHRRTLGWAARTSARAPAAERPPGAPKHARCLRGCRQGGAKRRGASDGHPPTAPKGQARHWRADPARAASPQVTQASQSWEASSGSVLKAPTKSSLMNCMSTHPPNAAACRGAAQARELADGDGATRPEPVRRPPGRPECRGEPATRHPLRS
jgi:hypothetical protein